MTLEEFYKIHSRPDDNDVDSLFRFMSINSDDFAFIEHLFLSKRLYHPQASNLNDPFEGKPHFTLEGKPTKAKEIRDHLIKVGRSQGFSRNMSEKHVSASMRKPNFINDIIKKSIEETFGSMRICSFTTNKDNLLFWSHYADSHKGFCIEFNASIFPLANAFRVKYTDKYPQATYPIPEDARAFKASLIKSKAWEYENEYRTVFLPNVKSLPNDGESMILNGKEITNIYLGSQVSDNDKDVLLGIIQRSEFRPKIWQAKLSKSSFKLEYDEVN